MPAMQFPVSENPPCHHAAGTGALPWVRYGGLRGRAIVSEIGHIVKGNKMVYKGVCFGKESNVTAFKKSNVFYKCDVTN